MILVGLMCLRRVGIALAPPKAKGPSSDCCFFQVSKANPGNRRVGPGHFLLAFGRTQKF